MNFVTSYKSETTTVGATTTTYALFIQTGIGDTRLYIIRKRVVDTNSHTDTYHENRTSDSADDVWATRDTATYLPTLSNGTTYPPF